MPNKTGLALLVRLYVLGSDVQFRAGVAKLTKTEELISKHLVYNLHIAGYLEMRSAEFYVLSTKGAGVAQRPAPRERITEGWASPTAQGRKIHYWTEYLVLGKYLEYEAACGMVAGRVYEKGPDKVSFYCPECQAAQPMLITP